MEVHSLGVTVPKCDKTGRNLIVQSVCAIVGKGIRRGQRKIAALRHVNDGLELAVALSHVFRYVFPKPIRKTGDEDLRDFTQFAGKDFWVQTSTFRVTRA